MMIRAMVIIHAEHVPSARALLEVAPFNQSPEQAEATFVPAGSPSGAAPATHWWLSAQMGPELWAACAQLAGALPWAECWQYDLAQEPGFPQEKLAALGLQPLTPETLP